MLSTRREQIVVLSGLVILNAGLGWDARRLWRNDQHRAEWINTAAVPGPALTPGTRKGEGHGVQSFGEIIDRDLFTPERSKRSPQEEVKAPALPFLWGTMNLGHGWFALMAPGDQPSILPARVMVGEDIGGYKLISLAGSEAVVEWQGKRFNVSTADSVRRAPRSLASTARPESSSGRTPAAPFGSMSHVTTIAPTGPPASGGAPMPANTQRARSGVDYGPPPGAPPDAPAGTVIGGRRKVVTPTPFGDQVAWVDAEPAQKTAGDEK